MSEQPGRQCCYRVTVAFKDMDMSGGDEIDGPRWTGKLVDRETVFNVVAESEALAGAGALTKYYDLEKAKVKKTELICEVAVVVSVK